MSDYLIKLMNSSEEVAVAESFWAGNDAQARDLVFARLLATIEFDTAELWDRDRIVGRFTRADGATTVIQSD